MSKVQHVSSFAEDNWVELYPAFTGSMSRSKVTTITRNRDAQWADELHDVIDAVGGNAIAMREALVNLVQRARSA